MAGRRRIIPSLAVAGLVIGIAAIAFGIVAEKGTDRFAAAINEKLAALDLPARNSKTTPEKAEETRNAIKRGQFLEARRIVADVFANSRIENWRYHPFRDFINGISDVNDPTFEAHLNGWVAQNPDDAIPVIVRAQYYYDMGWFRRGHRFAKDTAADQLKAFDDNMAKAFADANAAIRLDDDNPYAFLLKIRILYGFGWSQRLQQVFEEAIARYPAYFPLYEVVLAARQPKWRGTLELMYQFVDRYAGQAPQNSPLKLLYLHLYRDLLDAASVSCRDIRDDPDKNKQCIAAYMDQNVTAELEQQAEAALWLYDHTDKYQFGVAVKDILVNMLATVGGDVYSASILQLAVATMNSNTQTNPDASSPNNYIIDEAIAESWYQKRSYDNALTKYRKTLDDIRFAIFPNEDEKLVAISQIYDRLARISASLSRFIDVIAYERAAIAVGGKTDNEYYICYGYFQLQQYEQAAKTCTETLDRTGSLLAHYWRGWAYRRSGQNEAALRDFQIVADAGQEFRASAAIEASVIYGERKDYQGELDILNKYEFLYNEATQSKDELAVSYNNRCYTYMQLGELTKALEDCTQSLKYGNLPDARRKQQELVERLKAQ